MKLKEGFYEIKGTDLFLQIHKGTFQLGEAVILVTSLYSKRTGERYEFMKIKKMNTQEIRQWKSLIYHGTTRPFPPPLPQEVMQ